MIYTKLLFAGDEINTQFIGSLDVLSEQRLYIIKQSVKYLLTDTE